MVSGLSLRSSERQRAPALAISRESPPFVGFPGPLQVHRECWFQRGRWRERCSRDEARDALGRARGSVKIAVMLLNGCDPETAKALLDRAQGQLRKALALIGQRGMDAA
jgi:hypothetical protein